jgi:hypothetical protein
LYAGLLLAALLGLYPAAYAQEVASGGKPELQHKLAALKQSIAKNQQALRQYTSTETTETILKGETRSKEQSECQSGPDGKVQKTPIGGNEPAPKNQRILKGKVIEKKKDEIEDYMEGVGSLVKRYVPPDGSNRQESFRSGKASIQRAGGGIVTLVFRDYAKPGHIVSLTFDPTAGKIQSYDAKTYFDAPEDAVNLKVVFDILPDGTNYVAQSQPDATAKQIQIRSPIQTTANSRDT